MKKLFLLLLIATANIQLNARTASLLTAARAMRAYIVARSGKALKTNSEQLNAAAKVKVPSSEQLSFTAASPKFEGPLWGSPCVEEAKRDPLSVWGWDEFKHPGLSEKPKVDTNNKIDFERAAAHAALMSLEGFMAPCDKLSDEGKVARLFFTIDKLKAKLEEKR